VTGAAGAAAAVGGVASCFWQAERASTAPSSEAETMRAEDLFLVVMMKSSIRAEAGK
jgi:hypothetical protein